ncbi:MAG: CubicO group peptidase (beta-lactamase class C family) [Pseudohongiellaceae bacterium]|jgi:CubicO group peptidase (beta-lactamase class C family)
MLVTRLFLPVIATGLIASMSAGAQDIQSASPESVGMSSAGLQKVTAALQQHIDDGDIPGVVAAVLRDGKLVYFEALGKLDLEKNLAMREDAIFRIYSMTREITSVAVLQLYEQGKFNLDDPIQKFLPQFASQAVLLDPDSTDINATRPRVGDITIAQLLTHTSGLGSRSSKLYTENKVRERSITLDQMVANAAAIPLFQDPGTEFRYGIHATILGKLVEIWSGQDFETYLNENVFAPLAMNSTLFWAEGENANRLAQLYRPTDGKLVPYEIESVPFTQRPTLIEGGVGLLSSAMDFANFSQMILNRGTFNGNQLLKPETADLIYQNAVPTAAMPIGNRGYWVGSGWTLGGFNLVMDPSAYSFPVSEGTIWWDGSTATRFFIDPSQQMITVIMGQVSPSSGGGFRENFTTLVDAAITQRR